MTDNGAKELAERLLLLDSYKPRVVEDEPGNRKVAIRHADALLADGAVFLPDGLEMEIVRLRRIEDAARDLLPTLEGYGEDIDLAALRAALERSEP